MIRLMFALLVLYCSLAVSQRHIVLKPEFSAYFNEYGVYGSTLIYSEKDSTWYTNLPARMDSMFLPASTFKIPNTLISLETGALRDTGAVLPWDSVQRPVPAWNRDHNLRSAFRYSVVWFYQELARRIGRERMQHYVDTMEYGNRKISGAIDRFWLDGGLRISQIQQIDFLRRLYNGTLPVSARSISILKDIMIFERSPQAVVRAKTGMTTQDGQEIGWFVGYVEKGHDVYFFATCIQGDGESPLFATARIEVTKKILERMHLFP